MLRPQPRQGRGGGDAERHEGPRGRPARSSADSGKLASDFLFASVWDAPPQGPRPTCSRRSSRPTPRPTSSSTPSRAATVCTDAQRRKQRSVQIRLFMRLGQRPRINAGRSRRSSRSTATCSALEDAGPTTHFVKDDAEQLALLEQGQPPSSASSSGSADAAGNPSPQRR